MVDGAPDPLVVFCANVLQGRLPGDSPVDAGALLEFAQEQGIIALLADARDDMVRRDLRAAMRIETMRELARLAQARRVLDALDSRGIRVLVLKGGALGYWLYEKPVHRPCCDLDLLVPDIEAAEEVVALLESAGFRLVAGVGPRQVAGYEVALEPARGGNPFLIDLHWRLANREMLARGFDFDELWNASIPIPALHSDARGLGRVHALVHALLHRISNMPAGKQDRMIWLYDIHLLAGGCTPADWRMFSGMALAKGVAAPCLDGLRAAHRLFRTTIPSDVETALEGAAGREAWQLERMHGQGEMDRAHLAALPWPAKLHWIWRKLFPSAEFMRHRYGAVGIIGLAIAYLHRWRVGLRRAMGG